MVRPEVTEEPRIFFNAPFEPQVMPRRRSLCRCALHCSAGAASGGHRLLGVVPARLGEKFVQLGLWAFSELGGGGSSWREATKAC